MRCYRCYCIFCDVINGWPTIESFPQKMFSVIVDSSSTSCAMAAFSFGAAATTRSIDIKVRPSINDVTKMFFAINWSFISIISRFSWQCYCRGLRSKNFPRILKYLVRPYSHETFLHTILRYKDVKIFWFQSIDFYWITKVSS